MAKNTDEKKASPKATTTTKTAKKATETKAAAKTVAKDTKKAVETNISAATAKKAVKAKAVAAPQESKAKPDTKTNVLFISSEAYPFAGTGGLGEVIGSLPRAINELSSEFDARIILPLYESFPQEYREKLEFICYVDVALAWRNQYCGVFSLHHNNVTYYFIDNEYYFKRPNLYGYYDDGERFSFFSKAVLEVLPLLGWTPNILHAQDWQTALVPIYYKLFYMYRIGYENIKNIFTIHNIEYQGKYSKNILEDVFGISNIEYFSLEHNGSINLMKGAIDYADEVSTVSPTYAREILEPFYAHGLEAILAKNAYKLRGILNGVDIETYNPQTNKSLFVNYSADTIGDKYKNKAQLQEMLNLPQSPKTPVIALITRLVSHKGLDLLRTAIDQILARDVQLVILGKGDADYESFFSHLTKVYGNKFSAVIAFNKDMSHKLYSGADMFLMPSKSEPCGLSQMMACRYGTVPIVRATGGLKDSITDCGSGDDGNGFVFDNYDAGSMLFAIDRAIGLYTDYSDKWNGLVQRAINTDFSWEASAREYVNFYKK